MFAAVSPIQGQQPQASAPPAADKAKNDVIAAISFKGNTKYTDQQLLDLVQLKVGQKLDQKVIGQALNKIINLYRKDGGNLSISPNVQPNGGHAILQFVIDENGTKGDAGPYEPAGGHGGGPKSEGAQGK
jgi:hypothetical protein